MPLDELVHAGPLRAHYESPDGIREAGRRPKVHETAEARITVGVPDRRHEFPAGLLLATRPR
ncbi:hypothetical protein ACFQ9Z_15700 [Streptomyces sp. NPDC056580]|uniref:hypothetical protein n=1 Tax=Streptomyces sp. NPDC056580 TaxID=3345872 RepID=UPI0036A93D52